MNRLHQQIIEELARRFAIPLTDEPRQAIIDSLGNHPVNHATFAHYLGKYHPNNWQVYLALTKTL
jgi:hypothetical protein